MQASCSTLCAEWLRERAEWETTEFFSPFCQLCALFLFLLVNIVLRLWVRLTTCLCAVGTVNKHRRALVGPFQLEGSSPAQALSLPAWLCNHPNSISVLAPSPRPISVLETQLYLPIQFQAWSRLHLLCRLHRSSSSASPSSFAASQLHPFISAGAECHPWPAFGCKCSPTEHLLEVLSMKDACKCTARPCLAAGHHDGSSVPRPGSALWPPVGAVALGQHPATAASPLRW